MKKNIYLLFIVFSFCINVLPISEVQSSSDVMNILFLHFKSLPNYGLSEFNVQLISIYVLLFFTITNNLLSSLTEYKNFMLMMLYRTNRKQFFIDLNKKSGMQCIFMICSMELLILTLCLIFHYPINISLLFVFFFKYFFLYLFICLLYNMISFIMNVKTAHYAIIILFITILLIEIFSPIYIISYANCLITELKVCLLLFTLNIIIVLFSYCKLKKMGDIAND